MKRQSAASRQPHPENRIARRGRRRLVALLGLSLLVMLVGYPAAASADETLTLDTHESPTDGFAGPVSTTQPLTAGQDYVVTVTGTWSAYPPKQWERSPNSGETTVCGTPEAHPMNPSQGQ